MNAFKIHKMLSQANLIFQNSPAEWRAERKGNARNSNLDNPMFQNCSGERDVSSLALFSYSHLFAPSPLSDCLEQALIGISFEPFFDEIPRGGLYE